MQNHSSTRVSRFLFPLPLVFCALFKRQTRRYRASRYYHHQQHSLSASTTKIDEGQTKKKKKIGATDEKKDGKSGVKYFCIYHAPAQGIWLTCVTLARSQSMYVYVRGCCKRTPRPGTRAEGKNARTDNRAFARIHCRDRIVWIFFGPRVLTPLLSLSLSRPFCSTLSSPPRNPLPSYSLPHQRRHPLADAAFFSRFLAIFFFARSQHIAARVCVFVEQEWKGEGR